MPSSQRAAARADPLCEHVAMTDMRSPDAGERRPIPARGAPWAIATARWLQRAGVRPNQVSVLSVVLAAIGGICLVLAGRSDGWGRIALLVVAAATMLLRLLCNMFDGMIAVEGGLQSSSGPLYNEVPDRLADLLFLVGAGYAIPEFAWGPQLGWAAAVVALLTAYVRTLGAAVGATQHFVGPMAKPTRMHVLIAACLLSAVATAFGYRAGWLLAAALVLIIAGGIVTIGRRLRLIGDDLEAA